jgi:hypothetical protein
MFVGFGCAESVRRVACLEGFEPQPSNPKSVSKKWQFPPSLLMTIDWLVSPKRGRRPLIFIHCFIHRQSLLGTLANS